MSKPVIEQFEIDIDDVRLDDLRDRLSRTRYAPDHHNVDWRYGVPTEVVRSWVAKWIEFDWRAMGAEIESHPHFPNRTNVSFMKPVDDHSIDVRFYERGAGETMSSGTGSTGAAAAAVALGIAKSPVRVLTPAGPIDLRLEDEVFLTGPAELIAAGEFWL